MPTRILVLISILTLFTYDGLSQSAFQASKAPAISAGLNDPDLENKVNSLLKQMTLEEKVGQLAQYSGGQQTGPGGRSVYAEAIANGNVGALLNVTKAADANALQHIAVEKSRLHIPLLFGLDVIHGFRTEFPIPLGMASTWDPELVERTARVAAREASASGVRWTFSPMVDIARDSRWGRMSEGAGEDPYLGAAIARAYVKGYQGKRLDAPDSIAACAKHYVGYGAAEGGRDYNSVEISEHTLRQFYLPPFRAAVEAGTLTIMGAFNSINAVPASANAFTLKQILRKEWGFRGIVDSDWTSVAELIAHGIANDGVTAARKGFLAGVDMDMVSGLYHENLPKLVRSGQVSEADIDEAARRVLRVKFALGLFEHPYADEKQEAAAMLQPESVTLARMAAERSFVLLKNSASTFGAPGLPLASDVKSIALIGPLADDAQDMLGPWGAQSKAEDVVTLRTALTQRFGPDRIHYAQGTGILDGADEDLAAAREAARQSTVVILALGENAREMSGEAASRTHPALPGRQEELLKKIVDTGKPVVLVLFSGRPLTAPWAFDHVSAALAAWFPGIQAGPALVRVIMGDSSPSGKLVVSWPRSVGQEPLYYNVLNTGRPAGNTDLTKPPTNGREKYVSRYIDEQNSPQFPFGYGLSYSNFTYALPKVSAAKLMSNALNAAIHEKTRTSPSPLTVSTTVTNTGTRAGEEIVQLYIRLQGTSIAQPVRALAGFQRITLARGESREVTFAVPPDALAFWNAQNHFETEPSRATLWISPDSASGSEITLEIEP